QRTSKRSFLVQRKRSGGEQILLFQVSQELRVTADDTPDDVGSNLRVRQADILVQFAKTLGIWNHFSMWVFDRIVQQGIGSFYKKIRDHVFQFLSLIVHF